MIRDTCSSASCERHEEVRPRLDTPASLWAALARCGRSSHIHVQAWGDGVQVLAWQVPDYLSELCTPVAQVAEWQHLRSASRHLLVVPRTVSAWYVRLSHLRWTNDMELVPKQFAWAGHSNWLFSSYAEDMSFWSVLGTLSALKALFAAMHYINWHLYLHLHYTAYYINTACQQWCADVWQKLTS